MKKSRLSYPLLALLAWLMACQSPAEQETLPPAAPDGRTNDSTEVLATLEGFHRAAAESRLDDYFAFFTPDAVFIGTDAEEHWDKQSFYRYAQKPFEAGRGWAFSALERQVYLRADGQTAWFDELLDAPFAHLARGSGVLVKQPDGWRIAHYVLSMTVPNAVSGEVVALKTPVEAGLREQLMLEANNHPN